MPRTKKRPAVTFASRPMTRSKANRSGWPNVPQCEPRASLPLPVELVQNILFLVSEPDPKHGRIRYKYTGERRPTYQPSTDIQNARLVCRSFAALGISFLFKKLVISDRPKDLAHARYVASHPQFSKAIRTLVYEYGPYAHDYNNNDDDDDDDDDDDAHPSFEGGAATRPPTAAIECLQEVLPLLPAATKLSSTHYEASNPTPLPFLTLLTALSTLGTTYTHALHTLHIRVHSSLLAAAAATTRDHSHLAAALAPIRDLTIALVTTTIRAHRLASTRDAAAAELRVQLPALAALLSATSPALTRLKLTVCPSGQRRNASVPLRCGAPLSAYLGAAATDSGIWPALTYLSLGGVEATQGELAAFLLARRRTLEYVEFDRVDLRAGQWGVLGALVEECCPWRWMKQYNLTQVEEKREAPVALPEEVVEAIREARRGLGADDEERDNAPRWLERADQYYFEAKNEMSTMRRELGNWEE
ncbi:hypothetical protein B0J12DRAFT_781025 [Macrophomina phaseolina]|uniref:Uncharacterized protein n=1 Tax=Macrophomina phaseolina TaxID=35725 RepID=A0ABQ8GRP0_9PEZI|nr:hypothetical protein B0J12DRAFT_781025 [Macrophomina phaseolina]